MRTPGRRQACILPTLPDGFQSAPRCGHRGDTATLNLSSQYAGFNPRPGADTGATRSCDDEHAFRFVSIRAPVRTPGRRRRTARYSPGQTFQSAPRCGHRGDFMCIDNSLPFRCFNPRPGADTGATPEHGVGLGRDRCFNPRPGADTGATCQRGQVRDDVRVSIRAPVRTPGRPAPAPYFEFSAAVSIRAPVRTPGRPFLTFRSRLSSGFNPRPGADTGATC